MKVLKPDNLSLLYRSFSLAQRKQLALGVMGFFDFQRSSLDGLLPEAELWQSVALALGDKAILDEGWPKQAAEFMVYGAACAPRGRMVEKLSVKASLANLSKELYVSGDRFFGMGGLPTAAHPFERMPIDAAHAFGGPGFADNVTGKGYAELKQPDGSVRRPLPNIEHPRQQMTAAKDVVTAAGFAALAPDHSERSRALGKLDESWIKKGWPHLPDDTQLSYFQVAPTDQRLSGFLKGDENFVLENMHPEHAQQRGQLPCLRARCFIQRQLPDGQLVFTELTARAETVWLFPELQRGIVLYRASAEIGDSDADDVSYAMLEWERLDQAALPFEHYQQVFQQRISTALPAAEAPASELSSEVPTPAAAIAAPAVALPVAAAIPLDPELVEMEKLSAQLEQQIQQLMQQHGLTQADIIKPPTEAPEVTLEEIEAMTQDIEADTKAKLAKYGLTEADIIKPPTEPPETTLAQIKADTAKINADTADLLRKHGLTQEDIERHLASQPGNEDALAILKESPKMLADEAAEIEAMQQKAGMLAGVAPAATSAAALGASVAAKAISIPSADKAVTEPPAEVPEIIPAIEAEPTPEPALEKLTREQVQERYQRGQHFVACDLSELDLSGLNLAGAHFSQSLLNKTNFQRARLSGARFDETSLPQADFSEADLEQSVWTGASGDQANFSHARMDRSDLRGADFSGSQFNGTQMARTQLAGCVFDGASMKELRAEGCQANNASFNDCALEQADFRAAQLEAASFTKASVSQAKLSDSICDNADFNGADLREADFSRASLRASRAGAGSNFGAALFHEAQLQNANWEGAACAGASFAGAVLDRADFSKVAAQSAYFVRASAKGTKFAKADLSGADMRAVNLFKGSLRKANIAGAVLQFSNLYGVDFEECLPEVGSIEAANIDRTILSARKITS